MRVGRRMFLGGLLAGGIASLARVRSVRGDSGVRKRLVIWFTPNATVEDAYRATGSEHDFVLGEILSPLEPFRDKLLLFGPDKPYSGDIRENRGISVQVTTDGPSGGHDNTKLLTGVLPVTAFGNATGGGISVDQHIAAVIAGDDPFRSVELGVRAHNPVSTDPLNYAGAGQPLPLEKNPASAFASLFAGVGQPDPDILRRRSRRREVLRAAREEVSRLKPLVGSDDRARLDLHEAALVDIDARISKVFDCTPPVLLHTSAEDWEESWDTYDKLSETARAQMDVLATALGCGVTHVATMQMGYPAANTRYPHLSLPEWHHGYSHGWSVNGAGNGIVDQNGNLAVDPTACRQALIDIHRWHAEQLAYFLGRLAEMPESDGSTVLDNTVVFWCNELSDPFYHTHQNLPLLLAGSAGGYFRTGRYLRADRSHCDLLTSLCQAMGLPDETFGDPAFCDGPLPNLT